MAQHFPENTAGELIALLETQVLAIAEQRDDLGVLDHSGVTRLKERILNAAKGILQRPGSGVPPEQVKLATEDILVQITIDDMRIVRMIREEIVTLLNTLTA